MLPKLTWEIPDGTLENRVYLTFDDGPTPEITDFVLETLRIHNAKATFFCLGNNLIEHDGITHDIIRDGHSIGNHSMNHANAWKYSVHNYELDFLQCEETISQFGIHSVGFRPPYGRITRYIYHEMSPLRPIFMWTFLTGDYNNHVSASEIIQAFKKHIKPGSIIVMHDSIKAFPLLKVILPEMLAICKQKGLICDSI